MTVQIKVFREVHWGIGAKFSSLVFMGAGGADVNSEYALVFKTHDEAKAAAKENGWRRRFRSRVQYTK